MPSYTTVCKECQVSGDIRLSFEAYDEVTSGEKTLVCNTCEGHCHIVFDPSEVQFILKDGISGGWTSKAMKENAYRVKRREYMGRRERDNVFKPKLVPNYKGTETGNWRDAQEFARGEVAKDHGKVIGNATASTYEPLVTKESSKT